MTVADAREKPAPYKSRYRSVSHFTPNAIFSHESLKSAPLFANRSPAFLEQLMQDLSIELFQPGQTILKTGETIEKIYFLNHGAVELSFPLSGGRQASQTETSFSVFGLDSLFDDSSGSPFQCRATIKATEFTDCRVVHYRAFKLLLKTFPAEMRFWKNLANKKSQALQMFLQEEEKKLAQQQVPCSFMVAVAAARLKKGGVAFGRRSASRGTTANQEELAAQEGQGKLKRSTTLTPEKLIAQEDQSKLKRSTTLCPEVLTEQEDQSKLNRQHPPGLRLQELKVETKHSTAHSIESSDTTESGRDNDGSSNRSSSTEAHSKGFFQFRAPPSVDTCFQEQEANEVTTTPNCGSTEGTSSTKSGGDSRSSSPVSSDVSSTHRSGVRSPTQTMLAAVPTPSRALAKPSLPPVVSTPRRQSKRRTMGDSCLNTAKPTLRASLLAASLTVRINESEVSCTIQSSDAHKTCMQSKARENTSGHAKPHLELDGAPEDVDTAASSPVANSNRRAFELAQVVKLSQVVNRVPKSARSRSTPSSSLMACDFKQRTQMMEQAYMGAAVRPTHVLPPEGFRRKFSRRSQAITWPGCPSAFARSDSVSPTDKESAFMPQSALLELAANNISEPAPTVLRWPAKEERSTAPLQALTAATTE